jgi:argininosuccinate lyase
MREAFPSVNQSPLGAAALGKSSFPADRSRLAELLGFDAPVENSLDANQISPIDGGAELAGLATSGALTLGALIADITTQYAEIEPWIVLTESSETGVSSIMPQKRNPSGLVRLRAEASTLIGEADTFSLIAHNVQAGMSDKDFGNPKQCPNVVLRDMAALFTHADAVIGTMRFRPERRLFDHHGAGRHVAARGRRAVPHRASFRVRTRQLWRRGHHLRASEIPHAEAQRIYAEIATAAKMGYQAVAVGGTVLPRADGGEHGNREQGIGWAAAFGSGANARRCQRQACSRRGMAGDDADETRGCRAKA